MNAEKQMIHRLSSSEEKIALFRSLFRGREDVYAERFVSRKTGKAGYSPACGNEWLPQICDKPRIKCSDCNHQNFLPVTDEVIRQHLSGRDGLGREFVVGVYPLLLDETCHFLAIDLDKKEWQEDAHAILETCRELNLPAAMERSRSGAGGHLWLFFEEAVPATLARNLGTTLLTETMERRPDIGLDSYDRFFPNQDTLPRGGFGNLIALPLQRYPREQGNSVFVDHLFEPFADQWTYLSSIQRIKASAIDEIVCRAESRGRVIGVRVVPHEEEENSPWTLLPSHHRKDPPVRGPLPPSLELVLGNLIFITKSGLSPSLRNRLVRLAAFQNPEFHKSQAMRLPTFGKPRIIGCAEDISSHLGLPRGCQEDVVKYLNEHNIEVVLRDERNPGRQIDLPFLGKLRGEQEAAAQAMLAHDIGVWSATTAFGKTVIAAWLIAERKVDTLVLVHRRQLLEQWVERLSTFLGISLNQIGRIGGGKRKPIGMVDVALIQSLCRKGEVRDLIADYGHVIVDECHHLSAVNFEQVLRQVKAKFVAGLSATIVRKDGHHPIITMQCGPVRYRVNAKNQAAVRPFNHFVHVRPTDFRTMVDERDARVQFQSLYSELIADDARNRLICRDVVEAVKVGRSPLVLTERNEHLDALARRLVGEVPEVVTLRGGLGKRENDAVTARLSSISEETPRVLVATGRYIGEGFDDARLDTLFLTLPVSWRGTIAQYVGRLHRLHHQKREVRVYDYADLNVLMLSRMFDRRCRGYEAVGYQIRLPGSAVPGWPSEVPLPVDPEWKSNYSSSIQRLIRDGVDVTLANLFTHAARTISDDAAGVDRARSASEAFLFRRLETLPATSGLFQLKACLPISFNQRGKMEVDMLCATSRIVIEIDGMQHLDCAEAYRRDRRKDLLLQQHGYLVLRFLADDIGQRYETVLDTILGALANREATRTRSGL